MDSRFRGNDGGAAAMVGPGFLSMAGYEGWIPAFAGMTVGWGWRGGKGFFDGKGSGGRWGFCGDVVFAFAGMAAGLMVAAGFFNAEGAGFAEVWVLHRGIGGRRGVVGGLVAGLMAAAGFFQRRGRGVRRGLGFASRDWRLAAGWRCAGGVLATGLAAAGIFWWGLTGAGGVGYSGGRDWFLVVFG